MTESTDWARIRATAISPQRPPDWPQQVRAISMNGLTLFGVDEQTRELHWDGHKIITEKRFSNFERALAIIGLAFGGIGAISAATLTIIEIGRAAGSWS